MKDKRLRRALEHLLDGETEHAIAALREPPSDPDMDLFAKLLDGSSSSQIGNKLVLKHRSRSRPRTAPDVRLERCFSAYEAVRDRKAGTKIVDAIGDYAKAIGRSSSSVRADYELVRKRLLHRKVPKKTLNNLA